MPAIRILTETELRTIVPLDKDAVDFVENAFRALARENAVRMPPILRLDVPDSRGEVDVKTAYIQGVPGFAIKVSPGFFDNPEIGLRSTNGLMVLLSSKTGLVQALLLDNGYLTDVRTAAAGAVAARHLAREDASIATVFGAGVQARLQLEALLLVRPIREIRVWARDHSKAQALVDQFWLTHKLSIAALDDPRQAMAGAHVIVTTTPADRPIVDGSWLEPGQHLTAMGSDAEHKNEIDPAAIKRADVYVADSLQQTRRLGELHHAIEAGLITGDQDLPELGQIITSAKAGRKNISDITIADLTGTGVQDTAIATLAFTRTEACAAGTVFEA